MKRYQVIKSNRKFKFYYFNIHSLVVPKFLIRQSIVPRSLHMLISELVIKFKRRKNVQKFDQLRPTQVQYI